MRELSQEELTMVSGGMIGKNEAIGQAVAGDVGSKIGKAIDNINSFFKNIERHGWQGIFSSPPIDTYKK